MTNPTQLLSKVAFGALLAYSPHGTSEVSIRSRDVRTHIKRAGPQMISRAIEVLGGAIGRGELVDFFREDVTLVPAPRSSPLEPGWLWPAKSICEAMVKAELGKEVLPCLRRVTKVPKSAFAKRGERPTVQMHGDSMEVDAPALLQPAKVTIVDDVVTKGSTLVACASLVKAAFAGSQIRVFGLIRTRGFVDEIDRILDPCEGEITWDGHKMRRVP